MDVSFIIPLYNKVHFTRQIYEDLRATVTGIEWEVIFVDDRSSDETPDFLASMDDPRFRFIRNAENLGYAGGNNAGARLAKGRYLALINNDLRLFPGWLEPILRGLEEPGVGAVGNIQLSAETKRIDHAGVFFSFRGKPEHALHGCRKPPAEDYTEWNAVTAACIFIPRALFEELGGFDEGYVNGFEDVDLCLRIREAGYRLLVANRSVIWHHVSASRGHSSERELRNMERLQARWGEHLRALGREEWPREYARMRPAGWFRYAYWRRWVKGRLWLRAHPVHRINTGAQA